MSHAHTPNDRDSSDMFDVVGSLQHTFNATRRHGVVVLVTVVVVLAVVQLYIVFWPPIYQVEAMLQAEPPVDSARDAFYNNWNFFRKEDARTEIELMKSGGVIRDVIVREKLTYDDVYHPFFSHLSYLWETSWPGRAYKSVKAWLLGQDEDDAALTPAERELGRTITDMREGISIQPIGETYVGKVRVLGPNRRVAQITNTLMDVYLERRADRHGSEAQKSLEILNTEVARAGADLKAIADRRVGFLQSNHLVFDLQKETQEIKNLTDLETNISLQRTKVASVEASLAEVEKQLKVEPPTRRLATVSDLNAVRENAKLRRLELENALIGTMNGYREDSPEVADIRESIKKYDRIIAETTERVETSATEGLNVVQQQLWTNRNTLRTEMEGARAALASMQQIASDLRTRLARLPVVQDELRAIDREYGAAQEKYQALLVKRAQVDVSLASTRAAMPSFRVVDYAVPPASKYWPRLKILYPAALAIGLLLGVIAALIADVLAGRVTRSQIARGAGDAPLYAAVNVRPTRPFSVVAKHSDAEKPPREAAE